MIIILNNLLFLLIIKLFAMTKQEAIQLMREGIKVKHRFFIDDEWVIMEDSVTIINQDYQAFSTFEFWRYRTQVEWEEGWSIY